MIKIDKNDLKNINDSFKKLDEIATKKATAKLADAVFENAQDRADKHTDTGEMIKSLFNHRLNDTHYEIGSDLAKAPYAYFVHFGTKPHKIEPKERKVLRWSSTNEWVFARWVNHPGYKGDKFLYDALDEELPKFEKWLEREVDKI